MIFRNISLKPYNTFGLDYKADSLLTIDSVEEAVSFFRKRGKNDKPFLILGDGSNILFTEDYDGTIIRPDFGRIRIENQDNEYVIISAGAGIEWDKFVEWTVDQGYGGLENLSLIPGRVGAAPVQNIGAYGAEVKDTIIMVKTVSATYGLERLFSNHECGFGYRNSVFRNAEKGKYLITEVYFKLGKNPLFKLDYGPLKEKVMKSGGPTLRNIRAAVINIRRNKLPDPAVIGNAGSFFRNPLVSLSVAEILKKDNPQMPCYDDSSGRKKLAAAWLIDQCGWKGKRIDDAGIHEKQALVLVNHGNATGREIYELSEKIRESVSARFGILLEREVEIVGTI